MNQGDGTIHAIGNTDGTVADQPAASGAAALTVVRDSAEDLGYSLLDVPTTDEIYRGLTLTSGGDAYVFGESNGVVDSGYTARNIDVFLSTYSITKN